jgi:Protein of unknown function (DUF2934)
MTRESLEELRQRLLGQRSVQQMIQMRAYEIYQMRGGQPGAETQDWFHAEGEVLAFLIAHESAREDDIQGAESAVAASASEAQPEAPTTGKSGARVTAKPAKVKQAAPKKTAKKQTTSRKSAESKSKTKRTNKRSTTEKSGQ